MSERRRNITIVYCDDWEGIYVDGSLVSECHSHTAAQALEAVGFEVAREAADEEWIHDRGSLPELLVDCKLEAGDE